MEIPQIQFGFFLPFKQSLWLLALFGFLLKFSSGNAGGRVGETKGNALA